MSLEAYVLPDRTLETYAEWQRNIDALGFKLRLDGKSQLQRRRGHLPAFWNGREAGFECDPWDYSDLLGSYDDVALRGPWRHVLAFRWSTLTGCLGALMAASAYAKATDGVVFDPQDDVVQTAEEAVREAREAERNLPRYEAMLKTKP